MPLRTKVTEEKPRKRAPGAGRPKGDPDRVKLTQAYVSLTDEEKDRFIEEAKARKLTLSYYLRFKLKLPLDGAITPPSLMEAG